MKIKTNIDAKKILKSRGLGDSKEAQKFLATTVARFCDPYVPFSDGDLKNSVDITDHSIIYRTPYAHYQYHGEVMGPNIPLPDGGFFSRGPKHYTGVAIDYHGGSMRGKEWDKRMMADRKRDVEQALDAFIRQRGR